MSMWLLTFFEGMSWAGYFALLSIVISLLWSFPRQQLQSGGHRPDALDVTLSTLLMISLFITVIAIITGQ